MPNKKESWALLLWRKSSSKICYIGFVFVRYNILKKRYNIFYIVSIFPKIFNHSRYFYFKTYLSNSILYFRLLELEGARICVWEKRKNSYLKYRFAGHFFNNFFFSLEKSDFDRWKESSDFKKVWYHNPIQGISNFLYFSLSVKVINIFPSTSQSVD